MLNADQGMTLAGVGLAASVGVFAYVAVESNDGVPRIRGAEHLALFGRPSLARDERLASFGNARPFEIGEQSEPIDYAPVATIVGGGAPQVRVERVLKDRVILAGAAGQKEVRPGEVAQGFGRLQEIRIVRGRFVAVFAPDAGQISR